MVKEGGAEDLWIQINFSLTTLILHLFVTTIAVVTIVIVIAVVFTWSKLVLRDVFIWLKPTNSVQ